MEPTNSRTGKPRPKPRRFYKFRQERLHGWPHNRSSSADSGACLDGSPCQCSTLATSRRSAPRRYRSAVPRERTARGNGPGSSADPAAVDLIAQLFADQTALPRAVPVEQKIFLTLKEADDYSGLPKAWLLRDIKSGKLQAIKAGGWRIRRSALDHL